MIGCFQVVNRRTSGYEFESCIEESRIFSEKIYIPIIKNRLGIEFWKVQTVNRIYTDSLFIIEEVFENSVTAAAESSVFLSQQTRLL